MCSTVAKCLGFGQDRVNFHQKPGGDTAGSADPNSPNRTGYLIPYGSHGLGVHRAWDGESCSVHFAVCFVYSPYQYYCHYCSLCLLFC